MNFSLIRNKIYLYCKENWIYLLVMTFFSTIFIIQNQFVTFYADDYNLSVYGKQIGAVAPFIKTTTDYFSWMGGPTSGFAVFFLFFDMYLWRIVNPIIILTMIICFVNIIVRKDDSETGYKKAYIATIVWLLIYYLPINISKETIYWLDGSLAYVLTTFFSIIFLYFLYNRLIIKKSEKKTDNVLLAILGFFAGWNGPQAGSVAVLGALIILMWVLFINKEKIKVRYYISFLFALTGFAIYYFAPGNYKRLHSGAFETFLSFDFKDKILYRLPDVINSFVNTDESIYNISFIVFLSIFLLSILSLRILKSKKGIPFLNIFAPLILVSFSVLKILLVFDKGAPDLIRNLLVYNEFYVNNAFAIFTLKMILPYLLLFAVIAASFYVVYILAIDNKLPFLFITFICALVSQFVMVFAPYSPLRTLIVPFFFLIAFIACCINLIYKDGVSLCIPFIFALFIFNYDFGIFSLIICIAIYAISRNYNKNFVLFLSVIVLFGYLSGLNALFVTKGYYNNFKIYNLNEKTIEDYKKSKQTGVLTLLTPKEGQEKYVFAPITENPWVLRDFKVFYNLKEDTVIVFKKNS